MKLALIVPSILHDFVAALEESGLAYNMANMAMSVYRFPKAIVRNASEEGLNQENPCRRIKTRYVEQEEHHVLNRHEQEFVKRSIFDMNDLPTLLGLYTGMRLGKVSALMWSDIDWEKDQDETYLAACGTVQGR